MSKIKVGNREFLRPVQRLVPLEVSSSCSTATEPQIVAPEVLAATEAEQPVRQSTASALSANRLVQHKYPYYSVKIRHEYFTVDGITKTTIFTLRA